MQIFIKREEQQQRERTLRYYYSSTVYNYYIELSQCSQSFNSLRMWKWGEEEREKEISFWRQFNPSMVSKKKIYIATINTYDSVKNRIIILMNKTTSEILLDKSCFLLTFILSYRLLHTKTVTVKEKSWLFLFIRSYSWTNMKGRDKKNIVYVKNYWILIT